MSNPITFTGDRDRNGIPIAVGDLVRIDHFIAQNNCEQQKDMDSSLESDLAFMRREHPGFDWMILILPWRSQIMGCQRVDEGKGAVIHIIKSEGIYKCSLHMGFFAVEVVLGEAEHPELDESFRLAVHRSLNGLKSMSNKRPLSEICSNLPQPIVQAISNSLIAGEILGVLTAGATAAHFNLRGGLDLSEICGQWNDALKPLPPLFFFDERERVITCDYSTLQVSAD